MDRHKDRALGIYTTAMAWAKDKYFDMLRNAAVKDAEFSVDQAWRLVNSTELPERSQKINYSDIGGILWSEKKLLLKKVARSHKINFDPLDIGQNHQQEWQQLLDRMTEPERTVYTQISREIYYGTADSLPFFEQRREQYQADLQALRKPKSPLDRIRNRFAERFAYRKTPDSRVRLLEHRVRTCDAAINYITSEFSPKES